MTSSPCSRPTAAGGHRRVDAWRKYRPPGRTWTRGRFWTAWTDIDAAEGGGQAVLPKYLPDMAVELKAFQHTRPVLKALCLHVAHTCNLNCSYCFASQGKYHGDRALMRL